MPLQTNGLVWEGKISFFLFDGQVVSSANLCTPKLTLPSRWGQKASIYPGTRGFMTKQILTSWTQNWTLADEGSLPFPTWPTLKVEDKISRIYICISWVLTNSNPENKQNIPPSQELYLLALLHIWHQSSVLMSPSTQ